MFDRGWPGGHAGRVFATQRQARILDQVRRSGSVRVAELVEQLGVSDMTIRRDIAALASQGVVERVHGGATAVHAPEVTRSIAQPAAHRGTQKAAIALLAASLVDPGSSVAVSGGTTTTELAAALAAVADLTVFTNSLPVAEVLHASRRDDLTVVLTGGERTASGSLVGPWTTTGLHNLHVDWAFLGAQGMDEQAGMTVSSLVEAETNRALMAAGRRTCFVVDSDTWQTVSLSTVAPLDEIDVLVTDSGLSRGAHALLTASVGTLLVADA